MGLQLTLSALVLIGARWLFGGIAEDVVTGDPLTIVDVLVADCLLVMTHAHGTTAMVIFSALHLETACPIQKMRDNGKAKRQQI